MRSLTVRRNQSWGKNIQRPEEGWALDTSFCNSDYVHNETIILYKIRIYIHTHLHAHLHTCVHTCSHAYIHTHTHTHTYTHTHTHTQHTRIYIYIVYTYTYIYNIHIHTHTHTHTHIYIYIVYTYTHIDTYIYIYIYIVYIYTHIHTHILTYTGCPTRYRTRHFFNNFTTNEDIATKFEADLPHCVRNVTTSQHVLEVKTICVQTGLNPSRHILESPCQYVLCHCLNFFIRNPASRYHTTTAKPQRNPNTHRTRAIQPMK